MSELISIIVPVYGVEKYLRQCVDSVLAQTYSNWELILVDDGSRDACPAICDEYAAKDSRIKVIHQENGGVSAARYNGVLNAKGNLITFIDSDDEVASQYLSHLSNVMSSCEADCVGINYIQFTENKHKNKNVDGVPRTEFLDKEKAVEKVLYQKISDTALWGKLFKKKYLTNDIFTDTCRYEDLASFFKIYLKGKNVAFCNISLYYYRQNPESYLHKFNIGRVDVLDVTDRIVEYFGEKGEYPNKDLLRAAKDRRMSAHFNIFCLMSVNKYHDVNLEERCWSVIKKERLSSLLNPNVRLKNKMGAFLSYFGKTPIRILARFIYT